MHTLEYLITAQHLLNDFIWLACIEGQFDVVELMINDQFKTFGIYLNTQHVNGMTPFDLALCTVIRYSMLPTQKILLFEFLQIQSNHR